MSKKPTLYLVAKEGPVVGRSTALDVEIVIGADADLVLDEAGVAPHHAVVRPAADGLEIEDLGSTTGTLVNGSRIDAPRRLGVGDRIKVGQSIFEIQQVVETKDESTERIPQPQEIIDALSARAREREAEEREAEEARTKKEEEDREASRRRAEEKKRAKEAEREEKKRAKEAEREEARRRAEEKARAKEAEREETKPAVTPEPPEEMEPAEPPTQIGEVKPVEAAERPVEARPLEKPERLEKRRASTKSPRAIVAAALVVAVVGAGTYIVTRDGPSRQQFIADVRQVCALSEPSGRPVRSIDQTQLQRLGDTANRARRVRVQALSVIRGMEPPEDLGPELPRFLSAFRNTNRALGRLRRSVVSGTQREVGASRRELLRRARVERRRARNLGAPQCGGLGIM